MRQPDRGRSRPAAVAVLGCSLQVAWLVLTGAGQALTRRIEAVLDALQASPGVAARALDAWVLLPIALLAAGGALAAARRERARAELRRAPPRRWVAVAPAATALALAAVFLANRDYLLHRLAPVREGVLYRSAQLGEATLEGALTRLGIRTLVYLRNDPVVRERERAIAERAGVRFVHVPMSDTAKGVERFLEVTADPGAHPVLAHCRHGIARTGVVSAVYRMEYDRWDNQRALREARLFGGYDTLEDGSSKRAFILSYAPRQAPPGSPTPPR